MTAATLATQRLVAQSSVAPTVTGMTQMLEDPTRTTRDTIIAAIAAIDAIDVADSDDGAPRGLTLLSKTHRVTGHGRVGLGALAAGSLNGLPARVVVPIERVAAVDLRARFGGTRLSISVNGPTELVPVVTRAAEAALARCGLDAAELHFELRLPPRTSSGTDLAEAVALATVDAVAKACEAVLEVSDRSALAAASLGGRGAGLAGNTPSVVAADGTLLHVPAGPASARLLLVVCAPIEDAQDARTVADDESFGTLQAPPPHLGTSRELARWLTACSGTAAHPVADLARQLTAGDSRYLGVIGGHSPNAPVAVLLEPDDMPAAQALLRQLPSLTPKEWRCSITRTAAAPS